MTVKLLYYLISLLERLEEEFDIDTSSIRKQIKKKAIPEQYKRNLEYDGGPY